MRHDIRGVCKIFDDEEGWGWISIEGEADVWVHFSSIQMDGFKSLTIGEAVSFDLEENPNLKEQSRRAVNVKKLAKLT
ncbi:cold shock protein [Solibacillus silvestris StLB046]|uniref:Cold shock protein n=1 Tax=Solibacillus silvestris (strain StLB046) TaxID=1002809 RepID=F2FAI8_SOLSS|nr:cold shock domain-containing protein [Solibacillus silvestris]BAK16755.1 cold shock protein [Solibacillus silvestris StLB046]